MSALPVAKRARLCRKSTPFQASLTDASGERDDAKQQVYLVTVPRVLLGSLASRGYCDVSQATKKEPAEMIRDALENPMSSSSGGRPRAEAAVVDCTVVVQEARADGSPHFHAVVKLFRQMRFKLAKQTPGEAPLA